MEEILHQLIDSFSHYLQGFIHPRWCRISSINSSTAIPNHATAIGAHLDESSVHNLHPSTSHFGTFPWPWKIPKKLRAKNTKGWAKCFMFHFQFFIKKTEVNKQVTKHKANQPTKSTKPAGSMGIHISGNCSFSFHLGCRASAVYHSRASHAVEERSVTFPGDLFFFTGEFWRSECHTALAQPCQALPHLFFQGKSFGIVGIG